MSDNADEHRVDEISRDVFLQLIETQITGHVLLFLSYKKWMAAANQRRGHDCF